MTVSSRAVKPNKTRYELPRRFNAAVSEQAYENLRGLNASYGLSNNYLLTILLENLYEISDLSRLKNAFDRFIAEYGAPADEAGKNKQDNNPG